MMGIMVEFRNEEFKATLHITDVLGMTPLHRAAMFNRFQLIKVMLNHGADIDAKDDEGRSPCLLAASRKSWTSTNTLLEAGADSNIMDKNSRNLLHIVIRNNGNPEHINLDLCKFEAKHLLEDKDDTGCTPLHYASKLGLIATTQGLMHKGAKGNIKNKNREAPLHFAAKYGRYNTCQFLLETSTGLRTLNDMDSRGNSPLHLASQQGHTKVVQLLLSKGANIFRDENGNTPLHHAAENGYSQTMHAILSIHPHLKDANNNNLDTPLHLASRMGHAPAVTLLMTVGTQITKNNEGMTFLDLATIEEHKDVCVALITHDRWTEALHTQSDIFNCPIEGFIKHLPDVCKMVLDKCKTSSHKNFNVKEFHYTYDFTLLQVPLTTRHKLMAQDKEVPPPLHALNSMVKFNRTNLLAHPVCVAFLAMKWRAYGVWVHLTNLLTYFVFLAALTTFIGTFDFQTDIHYSNITFLSFKQMGWQSGDIELITLSNAQQGMVIIVSIFCLLNLLKELVQMIQQRRKYFLDLNNALEWVLYLSSGIFIGPFLARISCKLQWQFGTIAVFLAWFNLLLFLQRFDFYGIYVVMFLEILRTLLQALFVFSILLIAFGFSFYIILCREETKAYHTPVISLMSSLLMMTGNIEYMDIWVDPAHDEESRETRPFNVLAFIMLAVFIILMPILVMNLLIGLAVGDIEAIQKNAKLKRMAMQVELHTDLEQKLPKKLLEYVDKSEWDVYPNSTHYLCHKIWSRFHHTRSMSYPDSAEGYGESDESIDAYLYTEMYTHKKKLKQMSANLDKTYDLLRLVVQKMEIKTEADETDEAETPDPDVISYHDHSVNSWAKPALRQTLIQQASVIAQWKSIDK